MVLNQKGEAMQADFNSIREAIKRAGANWEVGTTSRSEYLNAPPAASRNLFGLAIDPERSARMVVEQRNLEMSAFRALPPLPPLVDWRSAVGGADYVTPVRDQAACGSCVSFATCGATKSRALIKQKNPGREFDLSEAHLFYCGAGMACDTGWFYDDALKFATNTGIGKEADFPYTPGNQACRQVKPALRVTSHTTASSTVSRKTALMHGPVIGGMEVFQDFYAYTGGVYRHVLGEFLGWHAFAVIGYDDSKTCWIAKNSWGTGWGESGFFHIAYGECGIDSKVLFYAPEVTVVAKDALTS